MRRRLLALLLLPALLLGCQRAPAVVSEQQRAACRQEAEKAASPQEALERKASCLNEALQAQANPAAPARPAAAGTAGLRAPIDRYSYCRIHQNEVLAASARLTSAAKPWILAPKRFSPDSREYLAAKTEVRGRGGGAGAAPAAGGPQQHGSAAHRHQSLQPLRSTGTGRDGWAGVGRDGRATALMRCAWVPGKLPKLAVTPFPPMSTDTATPAAAEADPRALTIENVERVLDELRPYLMADGGNVEIVEIDGPVVKVRLQGACGSCPSSTMTLKMGIERKLRESIPEVSEVVQVL